jgi:hypothetical protein
MAIHLRPRRHREWIVLSMTVGLLGIAAVFVVDPSAAIGADDPPATENPVNKQLKEIYHHDAAEYTIYRDSAKKEKLELRDEPVYVWTNVLREQYGSVFVWTWHGRPEVICSIFSQPEANQTRGFIHEFHSLSTATLVPQHSGPNRWQPKAGVKRSPIPGAPKPADSPRLRLIQMRELTKDFSAKSVSVAGETWEMRLLTQPLYRYQSTDPEILDGALFSFVTSAGTDPGSVAAAGSRQVGE